MKTVFDKTHPAAQWIALSLAAGGVAVVAASLSRARTASILDHGFRPHPLWLILAFGAALGLLYWDQRSLAAHSGDGAALWRLLPLGLGYTAPLAAVHYLTAADLWDRLLFLGLIMLVGFIGLRLILSGGAAAPFRLAARLLDRFAALSLRARTISLFLAAFLIYNGAALCLVSRGLAYSGDEPYYLLTSHSFYQDQDMNLANNYENNDYFQFYPRELFPRLRIGAYARFGRRGTRDVWPISQPGISALILPNYALSRLFKGRALIFVLKSSLALWGALLGVQLYLLALELWKKPRQALALWLLYGLTTPVLFFSIHIYPEVPIALFSLYIFRMARTRRRLTSLHMLGLGLLLGSFFWFGLKYNMVFWPLLLVVLYHVLKHQHLRWRVIWFIAPALLLQVLFSFYIHYLYGTFNPIAIYEGVVTSQTLENYRQIILETPVALRISSLFDYFLDQRDGLLLYAPFFVFALAGLIEAWRRCRKDAIALLLIAGPFVFNYAFLAHRQGHSPQARVLANLTWIIAIFVGYFLAHNRKKWYTALFWLTGAAGLAVTVRLLQYPQALYQPTTHEFTFRGGALFISLSHLHFYLPDWLPSFIKVDNWGWIPNYVWLGLIALFAVGYSLKRDLPFPKRFPTRAAVVTAGLLLLCAWRVPTPNKALLFPTKADYSSGHRMGFYGLGPHIKMPNAGEFRLTKSSELYEFDFTSWREIDHLAFELASEKGGYQVELCLFDLPLYSGRLEPGRPLTLDYPAPPRYPHKNTNLYRVTLRLEGDAQADAAEFPVSFAIRPGRPKGHPQP